MENSLNWTSADAARLARGLIHEAENAALGTLSADGGPHVSHVGCATLPDGAPIVLVSELALHTRNIRFDARASLLFVAPVGASADTATRARVTVDGRLDAVPDRDLARTRYLRRQPEAEQYADFADFSFMRMEPARAHVVAGFGRITDLYPADILATGPEADAVAAMDDGACRHMDEDHADAMALMANVLAGAPGGPWRAIGLDPLGIDLGSAERLVRVEFDAPATSAGEVRKALVELTRQARARAGEAAAPGA